MYIRWDVLSVLLNLFVVRCIISQFVLGRMVLQHFKISEISSFSNVYFPLVTIPYNLCVKSRISNFDDQLNTVDGD